MEKFIPYEKLSKKAKRQADHQRRKGWGDMNPVSRKPEKPNVYQREKARQWDRNRDSWPSLLVG